MADDFHKRKYEKRFNTDAERELEKLSDDQLNAMFEHEHDERISPEELPQADPPQPTDAFWDFDLSDDESKDFEREFSGSQSQQQPRVDVQYTEEAIPEGESEHETMRMLLQEFREFRRDLDHILTQ